MLMMQDIIKDLKEDIEKLTNIDIKLIAEDINSLDDLVNFLESLGLNDDTPGLALTEIINRGLNGIASTVSALNTIKDNARFFENDINKVPKKAITMGIKNILDAETIILMANGTDKAEAIKNVMGNKVDINIPVTALQIHKGKVYVIVDKKAASKL